MDCQKMLATFRNLRLHHARILFVVQELSKQGLITEDQRLAFKIGILKDDRKIFDFYFGFLEQKPIIPNSNVECYPLQFSQVQPSDIQSSQFEQIQTMSQMHQQHQNEDWENQSCSFAEFNMQGFCVELVSFLKAYTDEIERNSQQSRQIPRDLMLQSGSKGQNQSFQRN